MKLSYGLWQLYHATRITVDELTPSLESHSISGYILLLEDSQGKHSRIVNDIGIKHLFQGNNVLKVTAFSTNKTNLCAYRLEIYGSWTSSDQWQSMNTEYHNMLIRFISSQPFYFSIHMISYWLAYVFKNHQFAFNQIRKGEYRISCIKPEEGMTWTTLVVVG